MNLETAVRMSASFPYVSPNARPADTRSLYHLADGGYYDNYGMTSLNAWVREAAPAGRKLLLIRIVAFPADSSLPGRSENWFYQLVSPPLTVYNARGQGQILRDQAEFSAFRSEIKFSAHVDYDDVEFRFNPSDTACTRTPNGEQIVPPLSWHLSPNEKSCIQTAWAEKPVQDALGRVREFLARN